MPRILLVDDEAPLRQSLTYALAKEGYGVLTAEDGVTALAIAETEKLDAIILDVMLPGVDGMEVCRRIRGFSDVPIVLLTAKDQTSDKIGGLELGADDYLTKPFDTRELLARVAAMMRRRASAERLLEADRELVARMEELVRRAPAPAAASEPAGAAITGTLAQGPIIIELASARAFLAGQPLALSPEEYGLLRLLVTYAGKVVTRTELITRIWSARPHDALIMLDAHIRGLREKIEPDPSQPRYVLTIPGIGFQFAETV